MQGWEKSPPLAALQALLSEVMVIKVHSWVSIGEEEFQGVSLSLWSSGLASCVPWLKGARQKKGCHGDTHGIPTSLHLSCLYISNFNRADVVCMTVGRNSLAGFAALVQLTT